MSDPAYIVVKASARKSRLLTPEQIAEISSSKDLKELINRLKERVPGIDASKASASDFEEAVFGGYTAEIQEFIKSSPKLSEVLSFFTREVTDLEKAELLKKALAGAQMSKALKPNEDTFQKLKDEGYGKEVEEAKALFEKYGIPGIIDSVFSKHRLLGLCEAAGKIGREGRAGLKDFLAAKVDFYNIMTIIRGIRNGVPAKAIEELLIRGRGSFPEDLLDAAARQTDPEGALKVLSEAIPLKTAGVRELEKNYEVALGKMAERAYYRNYTNLGAVLAYLELKLREAKNLTRIANIIERGIEPKRGLQEFIY